MYEVVFFVRAAKEEIVLLFPSLIIELYARTYEVVFFVRAAKEEIVLLFPSLIERYARTRLTPCYINSTLQISAPGLGMRNIMRMPR